MVGSAGARAAGAFPAHRPTPLSHFGNLPAPKSDLQGPPTFAKPLRCKEKRLRRFLSLTCDCTSGQSRGFEVHRLHIHTSDFHQHGRTESGRFVLSTTIRLRSQAKTLTPRTGGKAKPLKAAKKEKKELDDDDKAFLERKKAGKYKLDVLISLVPTF